MKMKPTHKDFYMEIRKSPGRFLSILFIVALGVAFFSGIRASEPDMRLTGDTYFDESNLMDIKALSTYGVTQDDVDAILKIDGVEHAEGAYSADFMQVVDKKQKVLHVISLQDEMNQVKLSDGRMPQKAGECLADQDAGYKVGDTIKLRSGTSDEVTDTLTTDTLKVVGLCSSPMYISYGRGSATIGTGTISAFVMVPEETFDMDVYTEVYVQVKGAKNEVAFTDGYDKKVEKVLDQIEDITDERAEIRKQELVNEAQEKIDEAREELEQGRADAASELADAAAKIADAEEQLTNGKAQITSGKKQIASAKNTLSKKESELEQILEAGVFAPTGMGMQSPKIVVVQDKETIEELSKMNAKIMGVTSDPFYGAPTVLIVLADKNRSTYLEDGSLVMGNLMNAAHAVGVASCWIHRAKEEFESEEGKALLKKWGIEGDYAGIGHCILGYAAEGGEAPAKPRKEDYVVRVQG